MSIRQARLRLPTPYGEAPLLLHHLSNPGHYRGTVLIYHGLGASKEVQLKEAESLAAEGFLAVTVDAWGHGERRLPDFDEATSGNAFYATFSHMILNSIQEIPSLLDGLSALIGPGTGRFGLTGISMGGYIAFGVALCEPRIQAVVPILGSPDWRFRSQKLAPGFLRSSPHLHPEVFPPRALLVLNAGLDTNVPPAPARRFMKGLVKHYQQAPERLEYVEYPQSTHFMREQDWNDLWHRAVGWFGRYLG